MIFVTGDTHGLKDDLVKLNTVNFPKSKSLTKNDYVIICGDFGLVWNNSKQERRWLEKLHLKNFTMLWVDGNHENFDLLYKYPVDFWNGGKVHFINESVIHLMRGQIFTISGRKFFTFGGADSIDKYLRREGISWWSQEMPCKEEYEEGLKNLELCNWEVDYVISHDCGSKYKNELLHGYVKSTELNRYFDFIEENLRYEHWYFGHYHQDYMIDDKHTVLYGDVIHVM